ncbi:MAG: hypothetical protein SFW08_14045, partial [Gemmatimonadaceae bacterium]|nr:hypothetical protein [Gemmatimonadaceae bacterium]
AFLYPGANIFVRLDAGAVGRGVVPELRVGAGAAVTLDGQLQVAGPATLDPGATLDIGNDTLQVQRLSALGGILRMQDAAGYLVVGDSLLFGGDTASATPVLTNGVIDLYGSFDARVGAARQTFRATAPHRVRLLGSRRQTVRMAYGLNGDQRFGVLENAKSSGDTVIFESDVQMDSLVLGANTVTAAVDASVSVALSCVRAPTATVINLPACPGVPSLLTVEAPTDYHVVVPQGGQEGQAGTTAEVNFRLADADNVPIANAGLTIGLVGGVSQVTAAPVLSTDSDGRIRTTVRCTTPGSHGVSATIGGSLTTTARVVCAPAGTSVAWLGAGIDTTDWFGASNWVRYGINSSATDLYPTPDDRVYIPAYGQGRRLAINGATRSVRSWTQEGGALVRLTNAFLNVAGRLVAGDTLSGQGIEGSGEVLLNDSTGTAEASGRLTGVRLRVNAANGYTVSEPLVTDTINVTRGALRLTSPRVSANGMFRVDGLGTLQMQTAGTILRVGNMHWRSSVPGSGLLANGRIFVSGDWRDTSSGSFLPEGAHGVFFVGADQNIVFPVAADTSQRRFAELAFDNTGTVTIGGVVNVGGEFTVGPTVVRVVGSIGPNNVTLNTYGTVQVYGTPDLSGVGTHNAYGGQTPYYDDLAARAPVVTALRRGPVATNGAVQQNGPGIPGTLWVENGSALNVTGAFTVDSSLHVFGGASLQMETVGASLVVGDSLLFNNATPSTLLSEGTLSVGGPLRVIAGDAHALQPTGNFRLRAFRRAGRVAAQEWQFGNFDGVYNLPALINDNAVSSLELSGYDTLVVQTWEAAPNTSLVGIPLSGYDALNFATTCIRGALSEDDFQCAGAPVIADGIAGSGQALTVGQTAPDTLVFRLADANNVGVPQYNVAVGGTERLSVSPITVTDFAGRLK